MSSSLKSGLLKNGSYSRHPFMEFSMNLERILLASILGFNSSFPFYRVSRPLNMELKGKTFSFFLKRKEWV